MKKLSVHFGLNEVNPDAYSGWPGYLNACAADATGLAGAFARMGFSSQAFYDEAVTLDRFRQTIRDAAAELEAGDMFAISFSGHGGQSLGWLIGTTETLCLYDGQLSDVEMRSMLYQFKAGVKVLIILDSCHSGGMDKSVPFGKRLPRVAPSFATRANIPNHVRLVRAEALAADIQLWTACERDEVAMDGDANGAFTGALLATLVLPSPATWSGWISAARQFMSHAGLAQHPQAILDNGTDWQNDPLLLVADVQVT